MQDRPVESRAARYRRLAQECLEIAKSAQADQSRLVLLEMAKTWLRLAEEKADE